MIYAKYNRFQLRVPCLKKESGYFLWNRKYAVFVVKYIYKILSLANIPSYAKYKVV